MTSDYTITAVKDGGLVDNPGGPGQLRRQYVSVKGPDGSETSDVYLRRKPENAVEVGSVVFGSLEQSDKGWRLRPEQKGQQQASHQQGNSQGGGMSKDDYWRNKDQRDIEGIQRMGRAHAQEMALRWADVTWPRPQEIDEDTVEVVLRHSLLPLIDFFENDVDVGGGEEGTGHAAGQPAPTAGMDGGPHVAAADVSADKTSGEPQPDNGPSGPPAGREGSVAARPDRNAPSPEEASPQQKARLTKEFNKAGFSREARMAVVLYRCHSEKATKQGASQLIDDLQGGATLEQLLAEIWDGKRAGNPLAIRAAALIPSEVPGDTEGLPELSDEDKAKYGATEDIPF